MFQESTGVLSTTTINRIWSRPCKEHTLSFLSSNFLQIRKISLRRI